MSSPEELLQPALDAGALGLFAQASVALASRWDTASLHQHVESLAGLTHSDLVLLYEAPGQGDSPMLVAQWGLPPGTEARFKVLGEERSEGVGGSRATDADPTPLSYRPRTTDLESLGIRALWAYPLWSDGELIGQLFFGSRCWDRFHDDVMSVFHATTLQVGQALQRRRSAGPSSADPGWTERGGADAAHERQRFIAVLAHELRNPMAPIRSGLELLASGQLDVEAHRGTTQMMQRQMAHLVRLIDDLLDTVRLDTGTLQVRREPTLLKDVVRAAIESVRPALRAKTQALRLDDAAAQVIVEADPVRLTQAFVNILDENVNKTPEGGVVSVAVTQEVDGLHIRFEDEGQAITEDELRDVFNPFERSPMRKSDDGLGIGLGLVEGLVELNGGTVRAQARQGHRGTAYTVVLPVASAAPAAPGPSGDRPPPALASHRVLVVDDNRDAAETLGLLFELDGHTIRLAHDGPAAVAEAGEFQPEVILMDIGLPGFDGNEAMRRIRAQPGSVRPFIIALTGWGARADREASRSAGSDLHLVKPVSHEALRRAVAEAASGRGEDLASGGGDVDGP